MQNQSQSQVQVKSCFKSDSEGSMSVMVSIIPPESEERVPADICCVIDVSGSMAEPASIDGVEGAGLSVLDVVKHSVKTIIATLKDGDRLAIVSYSSVATINLELTNMDEAGKNSALAILTNLYPSGSTNIWDGLLKGMEVMSQQNSSVRNSAIFLLTDGVPNVLPAKGHIPSMVDYRDSHDGVYPATISTFGFGYSLKSDLLNEIALEGRGSYSFIPDSGFVGTIFVNVISLFSCSFFFNSFDSLTIDFHD